MVDPSGRTKVLLKIEQIARLRVGGMADRQICETLNISQGGLSRILGLKEYQEAEKRVLKEVTGQLDAVLASRAKLLERKFADEIPNALAALFETVKQKTDLRTRLSAAVEILDRDPTAMFAKNRRPENQAKPFDATAIPTSVLEASVVDGDKVAKQLNEKPKEPVPMVQ